MNMFRVGLIETLPFLRCRLRAAGGKGSSATAGLLALAPTADLQVASRALASFALRARSKAVPQTAGGTGIKKRGGRKSAGKGMEKRGIEDLRDRVPCVVVLEQAGFAGGPRHQRYRSCAGAGDVASALPAHRPRLGDPDAQSRDGRGTRARGKRVAGEAGSLGQAAYLRSRVADVAIAGCRPRAPAGQRQAAFMVCETASPREDAGDGPPGAAHRRRSSEMGAQGERASRRPSPDRFDRDGCRRSRGLRLYRSLCTRTARQGWRSGRFVLIQRRYAASGVEEAGSLTSKVRFAPLAIQRPPT
ncbi:hypothetical protein ACVIKP_005357 [Rhizobium leguminosarum]